MKIKTILNFCLVFVPLPILGKLLGLSPVFIFATACLGIIPLAAIMGRATEALAEKAGTGLSGLINATFGNACELILAFVALQAGFVDVVKASLTGSIIGNVLLVLGGSMLAGGWRYQRQKFDRRAATSAATLLALAAISLTVPAVFHYSQIWQFQGLPQIFMQEQQKLRGKEIELALAIAAVQLLTYVLSVYFSLQSPAKFKHPHKATSGSAIESVPSQEKSAKDYAVIWRHIRWPLFVLLLSSIMVAVLSEYLVKTLAAGAEILHLNKIFIGVILVAIIGNAAEHSTAVLMAWKNNMNLAISIALSSGAQIALFVAPVIVFAGFIIGKPIDLRFNELELLSIIVSVIILAFVTTDGECNWLEGVQLLAIYAILGAGFYFCG
jgi:Ca2+:H+ antiporter